MWEREAGREGGEESVNGVSMTSSFNFEALTYVYICNFKISQVPEALHAPVTGTIYVHSLHQTGCSTDVAYLQPYNVSTHLDEEGSTCRSSGSVCCNAFIRISTISRST